MDENWKSEIGESRIETLDREIRRREEISKRKKEKKRERERKEGVKLER